MYKMKRNKRGQALTITLIILIIVLISGVVLLYINPNKQTTEKCNVGGKIDPKTGKCAYLTTKEDITLPPKTPIKENNTKINPRVNITNQTAINYTNFNISEYEDNPFGWHPAYPYASAFDLGIRWHRDNLIWSLVQPDINKEEYQFKFVDGGKKGNFNYDQNFGVETGNLKKIITIFIEKNSRTPTNSWVPTNITAYQKYLQVLVERYDGDDNLGCKIAAPDCYSTGDNMYPSQEVIDGLKKNPIKYWQVENEPISLNKKLEGSDPSSDLTFAQLQRLSYEAIKTADPAAKVLLGSTSGGPDGYISQTLDPWQPILQTLDGKYADIFDLHWYGCAKGDYQILDTSNGQDVLSYLRAELTETGFPNLPIWMTEMGTNSGLATDANCGLQTEEQQASDYVKRYIYGLSHGIKKMFGILSLTEGTWDNPEDYFSKTELIYDGEGSNDLGEGVKKLSYYSYKLMTNKLEGSDWKNVLEIYNSSNVYAYKFTNKQTGNLTYIVWWDYWNEPELTTKQVTIPISLNGNVKITQAVPHFENGLILQQSGEDYPNFFDTETKQASNGQLSLSLLKNPVYIEQD
ncbi:Uncharacterised protein [uncultured archaeon]|nr:Uncharacterised protein [uncultured archaeon]